MSVLYIFMSVYIIYLPRYIYICTFKNGLNSSSCIDAIDLHMHPRPPPPPPRCSRFLFRSLMPSLRNAFVLAPGCFNEKGWDALSVLSDAQKDTVMQDLFSANGLRWGLNRMPIGSSDFVSRIGLGCQGNRPYKHM